MRIVGQALPVILIALFATMFVGGILSAMSELFDAMPGLLVLVPSMLALRGHIHASLGSRLSTAVHLGLVPRHVPMDAEVRQNVWAALILSILMGGLAGGLAHTTNLYIEGASAGAFLLILTGSSVGLLSAVIMVPVATTTVRIAFRRGIDPDNVVAPVLLTIGDLATAIVFFGAGAILHRLVVA